MSSKIYLATFTYDYEPGDTIGAFSSLERAMDACDKNDKEYTEELDEETLSWLDYKDTTERVGKCADGRHSGRNYNVEELEVDKVIEE